jgi:hypothetical protein
MLFWPLVLHAAAWGALLSAVLFPIVLGLTWLNPEILLKDYPPDIQAKHGSQSARARWLRLPVALVVIALLVALIVWSFQAVAAAPGAGAGGDLSFRDAGLHLFVMFNVFNLLDLVVLDWLIVVRLRPKFMILPGTEGLAGYGDYAFHFRGFLIGVVISSVSSLLVAAVVAALF